MIAEELAAVPVWVEKEVTGRRIPSLYADLANALQQNARGNHQSFEPQKDALFAQLREIDINGLSDTQISLLKQMKLLDHLGNNGVAELENILYKNALDISTAANTFGKISAEVQGAVERSNQIRSALEGLIDAKEQLSDEFLLRVTFDRDASISNVVDLKKWANDWHDIARGFTMAVGASPEELRVVGAQTGSIIITFATTLIVAKLFSSVILKALEVTEKVQGIRKAALEIEALNLSNAKLANDLRAQADEERKVGLHGIASTFQQEIGQLDGEQHNSFDKSIKKLLDFFEKGGQTDIVLPLATGETETSQPEVERLHANVERIRGLERESRRLSYSDPDKPA